MPGAAQVAGVRPSAAKGGLKDVMDVVGRPDFLDATPGQQLEALRILVPPELRKEPGKLEVLRQVITNDPEVRERAYGAVGQPPSQAAQVARAGVPVAGSIAGASLGTLIGGPPGGIVGAGIGAGGTELGAQHLLGEETDFGSAVGEGVMAMGGDVGGRLALRAGSRVLSQFMRRPARGPGEAAFRRLEQFAPPGQLPMRPAQATEGRAIEIMQNVAEGSLLGGGKLQRMATETEPEVLRAAVDDLLESAGAHMDADELAAAFIAAQEGRYTARDLVIDPLYNSIDAATGTVVKRVPVTRTVTKAVPTGAIDAAGNPIMQNASRTVTEYVEREVSPVNADLRALKRFAAPIAAQAKRVNKIGGGTVADDEIIKVANMNDEVPFGDITELRSRLQATKRTLEMTPGSSPKAIGRLNALIRLSDEAADKALKTQAPHLHGTWRSANELVKKREKELNNRLIKKLIMEADPKMVGVAGGGKPEKLVGSVFQSPTRARAVQAMLGDGNAAKGMATEEWKALERGYVTKLLTPDPSTGQFSGKAMKAALAKDAGTLRVLNPELRRDLISLADAAAEQQGKQASGIGRAAVQFGQYGSLVGGGGLAAALLFDRERLSDPRFTGPMSVTLLTPPIIAGMLTNRHTAKLLIKAMSTTPKQKGVAGVGGQLMMAAARERDVLGLPEMPRPDPDNAPELGAF